MKFPWHKYIEQPTVRKNTLQAFITNRCNLTCEGCFARNVMGTHKVDISLDEYNEVIDDFLEKDGEKINLLGGEPLLHPELKEMLNINKKNNLSTTIYTNGSFLHKYSASDFEDVKVRLSIYCKSGGIKSVDSLPHTDILFEPCFMVSALTTVEELLSSAKQLESVHNCKMFFISSLRELDNPNKEFFEDTAMTMPVIDYKQLVHSFLKEYDGGMDIHVSKRGVFESTTSLTGHQCKFVNYFAKDRIIQCPYDVVNLKFQSDYSFDKRDCRHNNSCLMSKVVYSKK